jgi:hypothetical protein
MTAVELNSTLILSRMATLIRLNCSPVIMNLFEQVTIHHPHSHRLRIQRHAGLLFSLFMLFYLSFVASMNILFILMFLDVESPQTLICRSQRQKINCEYITSGPLSSKTIQIQDVQSAIASQKPNGETIVLTASQPWIALQRTDNNAQNIAQINEALAQLRQTDQVWQLEMQSPVGMGASVLLFFVPIGLLFTGAGILALLTSGSASFQFDAEHNTITITKLGLLRSRPAAFDQLVAADQKPLGYLGNWSDQFGIYGGDEDDRRQGREIVRLLFSTRRPLTLTQTLRPGEASQIVSSINAFIAQHRLP